MSASSSTIRMSAAICYPALSLGGGGVRRARHVFAPRGGVAGVGEMQAHPGALAAGGVEQFDAAAMVLDNLRDDRQAKPRAFRARRHVGLEQALPVFLRKTLAVVDHVDGDDAVVAAREPDENARRRPVLALVSPAMPSVAFFTILVSACEISRRSKRA